MHGVNYAGAQPGEGGYGARAPPPSASKAPPGRQGTGVIRDLILQALGACKSLFDRYYAVLESVMLHSKSVMLPS